MLSEFKNRQNFGPEKEQNYLFFWYSTIFHKFQNIFRQILSLKQY
jgi:hypothetical protein